MDPQSQQSQISNSKKTITPIHLVVIGFIVMVIIVIIISAFYIFRGNPYGDQIKIDNFNSYYKDTPSDTRDAIYNTLHNIVVNNTGSEVKIPKSGAKIRENSITNNYNEQTNIHSYSFMVDIEELQQSYHAQIQWSDDPEVNLGGYPILFTCPTKEQIVYDNFACTDMFIDEKNSTNPIFSKLPVQVSYYNNDYTTYTSYSITSKTNNNDQSIHIIITDETGGNYEAALQKLQELEINPNDYKIEYNDISDQGFGYAGND